MKAILRDWGNKHFVVKDIEYHSNGTFVTDGDKIVREFNVLTIIDKNNNKYVVCQGCGETIPNTKKAIEQHRNAHKTFEGCFNCKSVKYSSNNDGKVKYTLNEDGTFTRNLKDNGTLKCGRTYYGYNIMTNDRKDVCKYSECADAKIEPVKTFFDKYPGAFDDMVTVDAFKDFRCVSQGEYTRIELKCRGNIYAYVNKKGIIEFFEFESRYDRYYVYYSKKYDKFFYKSGYSYSEMNKKPNWDMSDSRWTYIKETIKKLYN